MGIDVTNEDKRNLTIKSVHITAGSEDWQGWPTITVADGLGGTQFYAPSLNLQEAAERDRQYKECGERIENMLKEVADASRLSYTLRKELEETGKKLAEARIETAEANERRLFDQKLCAVMQSKVSGLEARCTELTKRMERLKLRCAKNHKRKNTKKKKAS